MRQTEDAIPFQLVNRVTPGQPVSTQQICRWLASLPGFDDGGVTVAPFGPLMIQHNKIMEGVMRGVLGRSGIWIGVLAVWLAGAAAAEPKRVVATFSILGDIAAQVGGDKVKVETLVKADQDAHGFEPKPSDIRMLTQAELIVANGLGFETWLDRAVKASGSKARVVTATKGIKPLAAKSEDHEHEHGDKHDHGKHDHGHKHDHDHDHHDQDHHDHGPNDPHAWQNAALAKVYAANIADALAKADPANAAHYRARAAAYAKELDALDGEIKWAFASIPKARRVAVTNHDAFAYFGAAYGVTFHSPIGVSTEAEPSAADVAALIKQIRAERITAVFVENMDDPRLIEQIARETGAKVGPRIYSDALSGPTGPASSYVAMMRHNAKAFAAAMK
jgi:zinc/manganese transport system substrate-binding protein